MSYLDAEPNPPNGFALGGGLLDVNLMDPGAAARGLLPGVVTPAGGISRGSLFQEVSGDGQFMGDPLMQAAVSYDMGVQVMPGGLPPQTIGISSNLMPPSNGSLSSAGDTRSTASPAMSATSAVSSPAPSSYPGSVLSADKVCLVCGDEALGRHFGVLTCEACKSFFRRSVRQTAQYFCRYNRNCAVLKQSRNKCQYCRYQKCIGVGMQPEAVQEERHPGAGGMKAPRAPVSGSASMQLSQQLLPGTQPTQVWGLGSLPANSNFTQLLDGTSSVLQQPPSGQVGTTPRAITLPVLLQAERAWPNDQPIQLTTAATNFDDVLKSTKDQLYYAIEWAKMVPPFVDLSLEDQVVVLKCVWNELLTLRLAFRPSPVEDALVLGTGQLLYRNQGEPEIRRLVGRFLDEIVTPCKAMNLEMAELVCMKALVLFNPDCQKLRNRHQVESLQEQCMELLNEYCRARFPDQKLRFSKILLRLSAVRSITTETRDYLVQQKSQGNTNIDSFVLEMLDG